MSPVQQAMPELQSPILHPEQQPRAESGLFSPYTLQDVFLGNREQKERENNQKFSTVVFGHSFADFDLDQLFTYYFALKLGLIPPNAPVIFTANVNDTGPNGVSYFDDPTVLVIEGFGHTAEEIAEAKYVSINAKRANGNIANGPNNEPAAAELMREFGKSHKSDLEQKKQLFSLEKWITASEIHDDNLYGKMYDKLLDKSQVDPIKDIFYGLKAKYPDNPPKLLVACVTALEDIISGMSATEITTKYADIIESGEKEKTRQNERYSQALSERLKNPETFKRITTLSGVVITYYDIRGIPIEKGAMDRAKSQGKSDILLLVADQPDPQNTNQTIGTQYKVDILETGTLSGTFDALAILSDRIQMAEAQFGKGYQYSQHRSFGSHTGIVASPQSEGSSIETAAFWRSLQRFFDYPRYSLADFKTKTAEIAKKLATDQYTVVPTNYSETEYAFGNRQMVFTIPSNEGQVTVKLTEEDLFYYEPLLTKDTQKNRQLLLQRTSISEPAAVIAARQERAHTWISTYLEQEDSERLLEVLDGINEKSITTLPLDTKIAILSEISKNPTTIKHIWDKDDLTYAVIDARLPEEILPYTDQYKLNRYKLKSLAHSIDTTMVNNTIAEAVRSGDPQKQEQLARTLLTILQSETYKATHTDAVYDSLLQNILFLAAEVAFKNKILAQTIISELEKTYGQEMQTHWSQVDPSYRDLLTKIAPESSLTTLIPEAQVETISGLAGSKMKPFSAEASLERILETNNKMVTFLVEVNRPIETKVMRSTFPTSTGEMALLPSLDAQFSTGAHNIDEGEHMKLVATLCTSISAAITELLLTDEETKLRIIQGGFMRLSAQAQEHISNTIHEIFIKQFPDLTPLEILHKVIDFKRNRLMWSYYKGSTDSYVDSPFSEPLPSVST